MHIVVVQTFLEFPIALGCVSGAIGANVGILVFERLYESGMLGFAEE